MVEKSKFKYVAESSLENAIWFISFNLLIYLLLSGKNLKMEVGSRRARRRRAIEVETSYPCGLQFYIDPPMGDIALDEFDDIAFERLKSEH